MAPRSRDPLAVVPPWLHTVDNESRPRHAYECTRARLKATNLTTFSLQSEGTVTKVTWSMTGQKTFMTKVMGIFKSMDSMVGPDFERGLGRLRAVVESDVS